MIPASPAPSLPAQHPPLPAQHRWNSFLSACAALGLILSFHEDRASWQHRGFKGLMIKILSHAKLWKVLNIEVRHQVPVPVLTVGKVLIRYRVHQVLWEGRDQ